MSSGLRIFVLAGMLAIPILVSAKPPNPPIELSLDRYYGFRPLTINARIQIDPNALNVGWCITWDSDYVSGRHCESFTDGIHERRTQVYILVLETPRSRGGEEEIKTIYHVFATVLRVRDFENTPPQTVQVLPSPF